jgi:hypothetical protein
MTYEGGTEYSKTWHLNADAGESLNRKDTTFITWWKFEIKNNIRFLLTILEEVAGSHCLQHADAHHTWRIHCSLCVKVLLVKLKAASWVVFFNTLFVMGNIAIHLILWHASPEKNCMASNYEHGGHNLLLVILSLETLWTVPRIVRIGFLKKRREFSCNWTYDKNGVPMCLTYHSELKVLHNNKLGLSYSDIVYSVQ